LKWKKTVAITVLNFGMSTGRLLMTGHVTRRKKWLEVGVK
jgi:hypothetical protein